MNHHPNDPTDTTSRPAKPALRRLAVLALVVGACIGVADTAHAMDIGGTSTRVTGTHYATVGCTRGLLTISPAANVQSGFTSGQYVSYRYYVENSNGYRAMSAWGSPTWINFNNYEYGGLPYTRWSVPTGHRWWVQVQVRFWRWNGAAWTYTDSIWQHASYTSYTGASVGSCFT